MGIGTVRPIAIEPHHDSSEFECGVPALNDWLRQRALKNNASGASRTFVALSGSKIAGYYSLAASSVAHVEAPKSLRRNMPDPIPAVVLGRLATDRAFQGTGLGSALLSDAIERTLNLAEAAGVALMLLHAVSEEARSFYLRRGFMESPIQRMTLCLPLATLRKA